LMLSLSVPILVGRQLDADFRGIRPRQIGRTDTDL